MSANTRSKQRERMSQNYLNSLIIKQETKAVFVDRATVPPQPVLHSEEEYDSLHPEETLKNFCSKVREMVSRYDADREELSRLENEMQDLLHYMEMSKNKNANEGFKLYKKLREVRKQRRIRKNEIELLRPVYEMFTETKILDQMGNLQGQCKSIKQSIDNRGYFVRTDTLSEFIE